MKQFSFLVYVFVFAVLIIANIALYQEIFRPAVLEVHILDVGKENAVFVRSPSGAILLINAGQDASILRALGSLVPMWKRNIDAVVLTENVAISAGGLPDVFNRYRVDTFIRRTAEGSWTREMLLAESLRAQLRTSEIRLERGGRILLGDGAYLNILWPNLYLSYGATVIPIDLDAPPAVIISDGIAVTYAD